MDGSQLVEVTDQHVLMEVSRSVFNVATASVKEIEALVAGVAGKALPVKLRPDAAPPAPDAAPEPKQSAAEHPLVKQAQELFGARLVSVQPRPPG